MNDLTQKIRRLNKHAALQANLITELGGEAPEMETAPGESDSSPPPSVNTAKRQYFSMVLHVRSARKLMGLAP